MPRRAQSRNSPGNWQTTPVGRWKDLINEVFDRHTSRGASLLTDEQRRDIYLATLARGYSQTLALLRAGSTLGDLRRWEGDQEFKADASDAINQGTDYLEDVAFARAHQSDAVLIKLLESRRPEKFTRDRGLPSGITIVVAPLFRSAVDGGGTEAIGTPADVVTIEHDPHRKGPGDATDK